MLEVAAKREKARRLKKLFTPSGRLLKNIVFFLLSDN